jgi:hypothetical protein
MVRSAARPRVSNHEAPHIALVMRATGWPAGQISNSVVQSCLQKYSAFRIAQITSTSAAVLSPRGALAIVTNAGQDAMDADVPLTNGMNADDEVVWF